MKKYDSYKDSGIEWLGEIPSHWEVVRFKYHFDFVNEKCDLDLPKLGLEHIESWTGRILDNDTEFKGEGICFQKGDILFGKLRPYLAKVYLADFIGKAVGDFFVFRPIPDLCSSFAHKLLLSRNFIEITNSSTFGSKMPRVSPDFISELNIIVPPIPEQTAIASYLDRKTSEIDELIAGKERLLELYEDEKTAIINQAVTGKLKIGDGEWEMKDSGIEWLGEIPEHWEVKRLKYVGKIKYGLGQPPKQKADGLPMIRATNVFRGRIDEKDLIFVDPDDIPFERDPILRTDDIIVVRSGAYTADSAIIPSTFDGAITGYDMVFRSNKVHYPKFISFGLLSDYILKKQLIKHSLRAAQPHLNREELAETLIIVPPIHEQQAIVQHIEAESSRIDRKVERTQKLIALLKEYRETLISEVVTGKVKVMEN